MTFPPLTFIFHFIVFIPSLAMILLPPICSHSISFIFACHCFLLFSMFLLSACCHLSFCIFHSICFHFHLSPTSTMTMFLTFSILFSNFDATFRSFVFITNSAVFKSSVFSFIPSSTFSANLLFQLYPFLRLQPTMNFDI